MSAKRAQAFDPESVLSAVSDSIMARLSDKIFAAVKSGKCGYTVYMDDAGEFAVRALDAESVWPSATEL